ncbi:MAG: KH domain-containing protein [Armatimonadota bacterium]|nr:KH domain-containing protein [Armatimonadota bacterium]MDR7498829.1 KH domain-containing protein [Armatimonadota bacterium]MDR7504462.1 KH domain-containing protein [Armatimonadota bacterium]MDR7559616.1 KH domain-containing protein [Armatimonadota bacterium]
MSGAVTAAETLRDLVEFLAASLVEEPGAVRVETAADAAALRITLRVAAADMGKVIGRQGRIARALRSVVRAAAARQGVRVLLDISSTGAGGA